MEPCLRSKVAGAIACFHSSTRPFMTVIKSVWILLVLTVIINIYECNIQVFMFTAAYMVGLMIGSSFFGWLGDKIGEHWLIILFPSPKSDHCLVEI